MLKSFAFALTLALVAVSATEPARAQAVSQLSSCLALLEPDKIRALELALEQQIASFETHLKRLEQPNGDVDPEARRDLRARYRDLLATARTAQHDLHRIVGSLASASSLEGHCTNGETP